MQRYCANADMPATGLLHTSSDSCSPSCQDIPRRHPQIPNYKLNYSVSRSQCFTCILSYGLEGDVQETIGHLVLLQNGNCQHKQVVFSKCPHTCHWNMVFPLPWLEQRISNTLMSPTQHSRFRAINIGRSVRVAAE